MRRQGPSKLTKIYLGLFIFIQSNYKLCLFFISVLKVGRKSYNVVSHVVKRIRIVAVVKVCRTFVCAEKVAEIETKNRDELCSS